MQLKPINQQVVAVVGASSGIGRDRNDGIRCICDRNLSDTSVQQWRANLAMGHGA